MFVVSGPETEQEKFWSSIGWTKADSRPSAIAIGTTSGLVCVLVPFVVVFCCDLPAYRRQFLDRFLRNVTGKGKRRGKGKGKSKKQAKVDVKGGIEETPV